MLQYNFMDNNFTTFESVGNPEKVSIKMPLMDDPIDIPWANRITENGTPIVKDNIQSPKMIVDNNPELEYVYNPELETVLYNPKLKSSMSKQSVSSKNLKDNLKIAYDFFMNKGLLPHQAAGIVGNLIGESKLDYKAENSSSKAYGIALWLGSRKKKLFAKYGNNPSFEQQLDFVWEELNGDERKAFDKLLLTRSVEEATNSFMKHFERPSQREMALSINNRIKYARSLG